MKISIFNSCRRQFIEFIFDEFIISFFTKLYNIFSLFFNDFILIILFISLNICYIIIQNSFSKGDAYVKNFKLTHTLKKDITGTAFVYHRDEIVITRRHIDSIENEISRFEKTRVVAIDELGKLKQQASFTTKNKSDEFFDNLIDILNNTVLCESIRNMIADESINAESAIGLSCDNYIQSLQTDDIFHKTDIKDVCEILLRILENRNIWFELPENTQIVISDFFSAYDVFQFANNGAMALICESENINPLIKDTLNSLGVEFIFGVRDIYNDNFDGCEVFAKHDTLNID